MQLMIRHLGTGDENTVVFLLDYGFEGYPVSAPITLAGMIPSVERLLAPMFLIEHTEIPSLTVSSYTVPTGGLVLDRTEYSQFILPSLIDILNMSLVDLFEMLLSRRVYAFYRVFNQSPTQAALAVLDQGESMGNRIFSSPDILAVRNPLSWYGLSTKIAECDSAEGFVVIAFWAHLLLSLPAPDASKFCPLALFAGPKWLPEDSTNFSRRYTLAEKSYTINEYGLIKHGRYIVSFYDAYLEQGIVYGPFPFSGNLIEAAGYNFDLTAFNGTNTPYGGWNFTVNGGYAGWTSNSQYIGEHVRVNCFESLNPIVAVNLPPSGPNFGPYIDNKFIEKFSPPLIVAPFQVFVVDGSAFEVAGTSLEIRE